MSIFGWSGDFVACLRFGTGRSCRNGVDLMRVVGVTSLVEGEMPGMLDRKDANLTKCSESAQRPEGDARSQVLGAAT
jgi:hypothetical protein